jgi:hypothetical protein
MLQADRRQAVPPSGGVEDGVGDRGGHPDQREFTDAFTPTSLKSRVDGCPAGAPAAMLERSLRARGGVEPPPE